MHNNSNSNHSPSNHDYLNLRTAGNDFKHVLHIDEVLWGLQRRHRVISLDDLDRTALDLSRDERKFLRQFSSAIIWDTDEITFHSSPESLQAALSAEDRD